MKRQIPQLTALLTLTFLVLAIVLNNPSFGLFLGVIASLLRPQQWTAHVEKIGLLSLKTAIVLLGLTMNFQQLQALGSEYSLLVTGHVLLTILIGALLGWFSSIESRDCGLIVSGTAICGGTAISALAPVIGANAYQTGMTLALVFLFNAVAIVLFPLIGEALNLSQLEFGLWVALAIHDTSSVVATASRYGNDALTTATTVKLGRILYLIPLVIFASLLTSRRVQKLKIPWFILFFLLAAIIGSALNLNPSVIVPANGASKFLLVIALFCIGLSIDHAAMRKLRCKTLIFALSLWLLSAGGSLLVIMDA